MVWTGSGDEYLAPSLVLLYNEINQRAGGRDRRSDGSIGDRAHQARTSDHNPAPDGEGGRVVRALDITDDEGNLAADAVWDPDDFDIDVFFEELRQQQDPRIKYVISDRRMYSSYWSGGIAPYTWRSYNGSNPHERHGHISILPGAERDTRTWFGWEEDDMTPEQRAELVEDIASEVTTRVVLHLSNLFSEIDGALARRGLTLDDDGTPGAVAELRRNLRRVGVKLDIDTIEGGDPDT